MQAGQSPIETTDVDVSRAKTALQDKMIKFSTEEEVKDKMKLIYSIVGLRPGYYPQDQEKKDLHDYIRLKYGNKTLSELVLAFDLAISNELDIPADDVKVYDQFTIAYIARIMSAYKLWLIKQSKIAPKQNPKPVQMESVNDEEMQAWLKGVKKSFLAGDYKFDLLPVVLYDYLFDKGTFTKEQKKEAWKLAKQKRLSDLTNSLPDCKEEYQRNEIKAAISEINGSNSCGDQYAFVSVIAKRLLLADYLKTPAL